LFGLRKERKEKRKGKRLEKVFPTDLTVNRTILVGYAHATFPLRFLLGY